MSILDLHSKEKRLPLKWNAAKYYDHPDGEDLLGKLSFVLKNATAFATPLGVIYANKSPKTDTLGKLVRIARFTLPAAAMGFTFTFVTYWSTVYRKKDDQLNHCLGGVAAGLLLGPSLGAPNYSSIGVLLFGLFALLNKEYHMKGYALTGKIYKRNYSPYYTRKFDLTQVPEIPGNWTKNA